MVLRGKRAAETAAAGNGGRDFVAAVRASLASLSASSPVQALEEAPSLRLKSAVFASRNRRALALLAAAVLMIGLALGALINRDALAGPLDNAIWLDRSWIYGDRDAAQLDALIERMTAHRIGKAYVYVSSLGLEERWSGGLNGEIEFMTSRATVGSFVESVREKNDALEVLAWVEIWTRLDADEGYRLGDANLQQNIADFSRLLVEQLGFDGVLLDVKPMFNGNDDLIHLINRVRAAIGVDSIIAVAATADLAPDALLGQAIPAIAPGTMWSPFFKQRILVSADQVILLMYQSYRQDLLDYVNWVAYHVKTYVELLESNTEILVSVPDYGGLSAAHNPEIETLVHALGGVKEGLRQLDEEARQSLTGIAIFADEPLSQADWDLFRQEWLLR